MVLSKVHSSGTAYFNERKAFHFHLVRESGQLKLLLLNSLIDLIWQSYTSINLFPQCKRSSFESSWAYQHLGKHKWFAKRNSDNSIIKFISTILLHFFVFCFVVIFIFISHSILIFFHCYEFTNYFMTENHNRMDHNCASFNRVLCQAIIFLIFLRNFLKQRWFCWSASHGLQRTVSIQNKLAFSVLDPFHFLRCIIQ